MIKCCKHCDNRGEIRASDPNDGEEFIWNEHIQYCVREHGLISRFDMINKTPVDCEKYEPDSFYEDDD